VRTIEAAGPGAVCPSRAWI